MLLRGLRSKQKYLSLDDMGLDRDQDDLRLTDLGAVLARSVSEKRSKTIDENTEDTVNGKCLPKVITFPYSRHSSYSELCHLVKAFNPKDIYPCTVSEDNWHEGELCSIERYSIRGGKSKPKKCNFLKSFSSCGGLQNPPPLTISLLVIGLSCGIGASVKYLFGQHCSAATFRHDTEMRELQSKRLSNIFSQQSQTTDSTGSRPPSPAQQGPSSPEETTIIVRKGPRGSLRGFAAQSNQMGPPSMTGDRAGTPPREILTLSPGSESQTLRRKAIVDDLTDDRVKRTRLQFGYSNSSPTASSQLPSEGWGLSRVEGLEDVQPNMADTSSPSGHNPYSQGDTPMEDADTEDEESLEAHWDSEDEVYRCGSCGHELLISRGECTICSAGDEEIYFEVLDPDLGPRPRLVLGDNDVNNMDLDERTELLGDCLDFDSSAYDSYDEIGVFEDEYEINSFINDDDESISDFEDEDEDSDLETDYRQKFLELETSYRDLQVRLANAMDDYHDFRQDILGSDYESVDEEDLFNPFEGLDDILVVDVAPLDPVVTEVILSQSDESQKEEPGTPDSLVNEILLTEAEGQSQKTEVLTEEEDARAEAYEAALDGRWHFDVSLVSTSGNHTHEETEL
jgi:hypothetical protein